MFQHNEHDIAGPQPGFSIEIRVGTGSALQLAKGNILAYIARPEVAKSSVRPFHAMTFQSLEQGLRRCVGGAEGHVKRAFCS
jgi:hypothetical protein